MTNHPDPDIQAAVDQLIKALRKMRGLAWLDAITSVLVTFALIWLGFALPGFTTEWFVVLGASLCSGWLAGGRIFHLWDFYH